MDVHQKISRVLEGYTKGFKDLDGTVLLLQGFYRKGLSPDEQKGFFEVLSSLLLSSPLPKLESVYEARTNHNVIIRAFSQFGPTNHLPNLVFNILSVQCNAANLMEVWARSVCSELSWSLWSNQARFSDVALQNIMARCNQFTYSYRAGLDMPECHKPFIEELLRLEKMVEQIEFDRFSQTILADSVSEKPEPPVEELTALLRSLSIDLDIKEALRKAGDYLKSDGPFEPQAAGGLLRSCMDETHRAIIPHLEAITKHPYDGKESDEDRRQFMQAVGFISPAEKTFFTAIYSLISKEAVHKLAAPKETVWVMEITVNAYLKLLLRRLSAWKTQGNV